MLLYGLDRSPWPLGAGYFNPVLTDTEEGWLFPEPLAIPTTTNTFRIGVFPREWLTYPESNMAGPDFIEMGSSEFAILPPFIENDPSFLDAFSGIMARYVILDHHNRGAWTDLLRTHEQAMALYERRVESSFLRRGIGMWSRVLLATVITGRDQSDIRRLMASNTDDGRIVQEYAVRYAFDAVNDGRCTDQQISGLFE